MSKRPDVIRVGDHVRVVVPRIVSRVGYRNTLQSYMEITHSEFFDSIQELITKAGLKPLDIGSKSYDRIMFEFAHMRAIKDGFGGNRRELHTELVPILQDREFRVRGVRSVCTGTRYAESGWDEDYEGAGLNDKVVHRLIKIDSAEGSKSDTWRAEALVELHKDWIKKL